MANTPQATRGITAKPIVGSIKAPSIINHATKVQEILRRVEENYTGCQLYEQEKALFVPRYVPDEELRNYWESRAGFTSPDYKTLKDEILADYSITSRTTRYFTHQLEALVRNNATIEITTEAELVKYYRQFDTMTHHLIKQADLDEKYKNDYFWAGLHVNNQMAIMARLLQVDPTHDQSKSPSVKEALTAGK
jgi:hypothetical protein